MPVDGSLQVEYPRSRSMGSFCRDPHKPVPKWSQANHNQPARVPYRIQHMAYPRFTPSRPTTLALGLGLLAAPLLSGQGRTGQAMVRGSVVTPEDRPIAQAIVELRVRGDSGPVRSTQSSDAGRFQLDSIAEGVYHLLIRRIGFGPASTPDFTVTGAQVRELGRIRLQAGAVQLAPIEVTVERPDVTFDPTRTGYLVEALTTAAGGVVTDALRELPDVVVELDGTIRLRGNSPAIYINGRPAPMQGVSLAVFLEQFPADRIERIEVLDSPPARFSAEGAAGIINIVLKEGVELGLTGSLSFAAGTRGQYTAGGRGTLQRGHFPAAGCSLGSIEQERRSPPGSALRALEEVTTLDPFHGQRERQRPERCHRGDPPG